MGAYIFLAQMVDMLISKHETNSFIFNCLYYYVYIWVTYSDVLF